MLILLKDRSVVLSEVFKQNGVEVALPPGGSTWFGGQDASILKVTADTNPLKATLKWLASGITQVKVQVLDSAGNILAEDVQDVTCSDFSLEGTFGPQF